MRKILIIDDDATLLAALQAHLSKHGYQVLTASSGKEGVRLAVTHEPRLIVLDLGLPHIDGLDVLEQLRVAAVTSETPVLVVTGSKPPKERERLLKLGVRRLLAKPCSPRQLACEIERLLRSQDETVDSAAP